MHGETLKIFPYNSTFKREEFNYTDEFYVKLIDVYVVCLPIKIACNNPNAAKIELDFSFGVVTAVLNLIYGECAIVKECDITDFTRACATLQVSFTVRFKGDVPTGNSDTASSGVSSGAFPSDSGGKTSATPSSISSNWNFPEGADEEMHQN